jgi:hypothetical protein
MSHRLSPGSGRGGSASYVDFSQAVAFPVFQIEKSSSKNLVLRSLMNTLSLYACAGRAASTTASLSRRASSTFTKDPAKPMMVDSGGDAKAVGILTLYFDVVRTHERHDWPGCRKLIPYPNRAVPAGPFAPRRAIQRISIGIHRLRRSRFFTIAHDDRSRPEYGRRTTCRFLFQMDSLAPTTAKALARTRRRNRSGILAARRLPIAMPGREPIRSEASRLQSTAPISQ